MKQFKIIRKFLMLLFVFGIGSFSAFAQTCLTAWENKVPIVIDNSAGAELTDYQIKLILDTETPIALGEMNVDGSDIRFVTDGCCDQLCYYIESGINTAATEVWVNVPLIEAGTTQTIYLFFGNSDAEPSSDASCTFTFFAGFDDEYTGFEYMCGTIADSTVSGGNMNLSWSSSGMIGTAMTFPMDEIYTAEMMTNGTSGNWPAMYWAKESTEKNYGLMVDGSQARISLSGAGSGWCSGHNWASSLETYSDEEGLWSFTWIATGDLIADFPTVGAITTDNSLYAKDEDLRLLLGGISSGSGSMNLDWIRVRKYAETPPTYSISLPVDFEPGPVLDLDDEVMGCVETVLDAGSGYDIYEWSTGGMDQLETVDESGTYTVTVTDGEGCYQVGSIDVAIGLVYDIELSDIVCPGGSYTFPDGTTETDITETLTHVSEFVTEGFGCDSIISVTIDLYDYSPVLDLGDDITSCDDTVYLDGGDDFASYEWSDGSMSQLDTVFASDTYTLTVIDDNGCEQTESIEVTFVVIDNGTTLDGFTINANDLDADSYQWLDCDDDYAIIDGADGSSYEALMDGNYAVQLTKGECVDTSDCTTISGVGLGENKNAMFYVYPNPSQGLINIVIGDQAGLVYLRVTNAAGEIIHGFETQDKQIDLQLEGARGVYFVALISGDETSVIKVVKN